MATLQAAVSAVSGVSWLSARPSWPVAGQAWSDDGGLRVVLSVAGSSSSLSAAAVTAALAAVPAYSTSSPTTARWPIAGTDAIVASWAPSGALAGDPTAPTASPGDADTSVATTAFVSAAVTAQAETDAATYAAFLRSTATKTGNYTAAARDLVPVNATGGNVVVTLPTGAAAGARVGVRRMDATANTITVQRGGADVIVSGTGTATSVTLTLQDRTVIFQSDGAGTWTPVYGYQALAAMDTRYASMADPRFGVAWQSGRYYYSTSFTGPSTSAVLGVGSLRAAPLLVPSTTTVIRIGAEVTSAGDAGSKLRLGIYADDGTGHPGLKILDAGQIAGDSATVQEITISQSLTKGWCWLAGVVQSVTVTQPTIRILGGPSGYVDGGTTTPSANGNPIGVLHNGTVSDALPDTFVVQTIASSAPRLFIKTA